MEDLIKALQIFLKYRNLQNPTSCEYEALIIYEIGFDEVSFEDRKELEKLGFFWKDEDDEEIGCWMSYRFGN